MSAQFDLFSSPFRGPQGSTQAPLRAVPRPPMREPEPPAQRHSATSREAAEAIRPHAGSIRLAVLRCIARAGDRGITDEAIASELDINPSTERPRRIELLSDGLIEATGEAMTRSGRRAIAWGATAEGISLVCDEDRHSDAGSEGGR